jgi:nucleotide-binding universal stress UspA family protein
LIVPAVGRFERVGRRVLVAWNASREAARALGDALPLLVDAQAVTVLSIGSTATIDNEHRGADVTRRLARHGITATAAASIAKDADVGDVLLSRAADHGADLIVMGAYGHSRTREWLLGGAARHLLRHMTVPVLMAH